MRRRSLFRLAPIVAPTARQWYLSLAVSVSAALMFVPTGVEAQFGKLSVPVRPTSDTAATRVAPGSPRASVEEFLRLAKAQDWVGAAAYLAVPEASRENAPVLARRLKLVLDQKLDFHHPVPRRNFH